MAKMARRLTHDMEEVKPAQRADPSARSRIGRSALPALGVISGSAKVGVQSCGALIDLVAEGKFRHRGQTEIEDALRGAVVKTFSDSWVYSRSRSRSDVSPLLAAADALWLAELELPRTGATALVIY
jgi:hypothetical protein